MDIKNKAFKDWMNFEKNLKYSNRFFIAPEFQNNLIRAIYLHSGELFKGKVLYRSRINDSEPFDKPIIIGKMGAPQNHKTFSNRANPKGISYLYTSLNEPTCVNESKSGIGKYLTIAKFKLNHDIRIVDLYDAFPVQTDEYVNYLGFRLHTTFSKPIDYSKSDIEYLPYQFISELIKRQNFHGVLYRSLFGKSSKSKDDSNLVLFNENLVTPDPKTYTVKITEVSVSYV